MRQGGFLRPFTVFVLVFLSTVLILQVVYRLLDLSGYYVLVLKSQS